MSPLIALAILSCWYGPDPHRHDVSSRGSAPAPEPDISEAARLMIGSNDVVLISRTGGKLAGQRCLRSDGEIEWCEVTFLAGSAIVDRVTVFDRRIRASWSSQIAHARTSVEDAIARNLGADHVALARNGRFGMREVTDPEIVGRIAAGKLELVLWETNVVLATMRAPEGVALVRGGYVSRRAPGFRVVEILAQDDRTSGYVVFSISPDNAYAVAGVMPLIERPSTAPPVL